MAARILVLEDDPDQSTLICDALMVDGHECVVATSVDQAEQVLDGGAIDLAIVDMNLPGRPGTEALAYIRSRPVLFLVKPLNLKELRVLVQRCLLRQ